MTLSPDRTAADLMTPRVRTDVMRGSDRAEDLVRAARRTGHSRFPVIGSDLDDVLGVVHVKAAVAVPRELRAEVAVTELMTDPLRLPETVRSGPLLAALRGHGLQLAVVVDEYGGTAGVVTLEDVVEEIVGEVSDEHDRTRPGVVRRPDGTWLVPGLMRPDEVRDRTGVEVPEAPAYETVGGLVMARLGRVPVVGDEVPLPGALLRVERMDGRRVDRIRLTGHAARAHRRALRAGAGSRSGGAPHLGWVSRAGFRPATALMLPCDRLRTVPTGCTPAEVEAAVAETGFSRFPVTAPVDGPDQLGTRLLGYLHVKDVLHADDAQYRRPVPIRRVRALPAVPAATGVPTVLAAMRLAGAHLALVLDEDGHRAGVVFFDDVLADLVSTLSSESSATQR